MLLQQHPDATCPYCNRRLWFGTKAEPTGWKVFYVCHDDRGCGREWLRGRISRSSVERVDDVAQLAEDFGGP